MRRRTLAAVLRQLRKDAGESIDDVCRALDWDPSKLSRIENRRIGIQTTDTRRLLDHYGVTDEPTRNRLIDIARRATERGWWQRPGSAIPSDYADLIGLESEADVISTYQGEAVPGLLQTADYARALIRAARPRDTAQQIDNRVEVRLARQGILNQDNPPRLRVVLGEGAVKRVVGGPDVMRAQLAALAAERDQANVTVQILPFTAGEHPAMTASFVKLDFPELLDLGVIYVENLRSALLLEEEEDLQVYGEVWDWLSAAALGPRETRSVLHTLIEELS